MTIPRWSPPIQPSKLEARILKRLGRTKKSLAFLREHRQELFDDSFQDEFAAMYRDTGGKEAVAPAKLAMGLLLQGCVKASDAEAVELTVMDLRWRMVLDHFDDDPAFSQGALHDFRHRLIKHDMDRRLLERTVELARKTKGFDAKKLPGMLRVAIDSSPLEGAGRVEDTINLLGHAARRLVMCVATLLEMEFEYTPRAPPRPPRCAAGSPSTLHGRQEERLRRPACRVAAESGDYASVAAASGGARHEVGWIQTVCRSRIRERAGMSLKPEAYHARLNNKNVEIQENGAIIEKGKAWAFGHVERHGKVLPLKDAILTEKAVSYVKALTPGIDNWYPVSK